MSEAGSGEKKRKPIKKKSVRGPRGGQDSREKKIQKKFFLGGGRESKRNPDLTRRRTEQAVGQSTRGVERGALRKEKNDP